MGARTTRRRPLPVARRHRKGLLCRPMTGARPRPARRSSAFPSRCRLSFSPSVVCSSFRLCSARAHVHSSPYVPVPVPLQYPHRPGLCISLFRFAQPFALPPYSLFFFFLFLFCACLSIVYSLVRPSVVQLYHRSFHTHSRLTQRPCPPLTLHPRPARALHPSASAPAPASLKNLPPIGINTSRPPRAPFHHSRRT